MKRLDGQHNSRATWACGVCGFAREPNTNCRPCANKRNADYKARNAEKVKAARSAYKKAQHAAGAEKRAELKAAKRASCAARRAAARQKWKAANPHALVESCARRFATKLQATPAWANLFFAREAYALAKLREKVCGGKWHVDHIVPLRSKVVCGLHVETNLRVIPATANISKGNRHWPDMP